MIDTFKKKKKDQTKLILDKMSKNKGKISLGFEILITCLLGPQG
jgi:hypothetical protein